MICVVVSSHKKCHCCLCMCCFCLFGRMGSVSELALERKAKTSIDNICGGFPVFNGDLQRLNNCPDFPWFLSAINNVDQVLLRTFFPDHHPSLINSCRAVC